MPAQRAEPQNLTPKQAYDLLRQEPQAVLIDIRSTLEFLLIGHPVGAHHIPWLDEPDWMPNPCFVTQVRELMLSGTLRSNDDYSAIILICRNGQRSREVGEKLIEADFRRVYHIESGFEGPFDEAYHRSTLAGWRFAGLPWEQC